MVTLEANINSIKEINDKRFEMLGWGLALLLTTLMGLLIVNFINSKASVRDFVLDELKEKQSDYNTKYSKLIEDITTKQKVIDTEFDLLFNTKEKT